MSDTPEPNEPDPTELVHARYMGGTPIVMPHLETAERCCRKENQRPHEPLKVKEDEEPSTILAHTYLEKGDVILLDRRSAEGRADFDLVDEASPEASDDRPGSRGRPPRGRTQGATETVKES